MTTTPYRVELDVFSGPLDLLLYLVRRNEVAILDLSIARITIEFQKYLTILQFIDLDIAGDFVVMASTLIEVKSRLVLPRAAEEAEPEITEDPRSELIQQLLAYKKFKDAAHSLEKRAAQWQERYPRLTDDRPVQGKNPSADRIKEVELWDLVSALARVVERKVIQEETSIRYDETPISVYVEQIGARVRKEGRVAFTSLFDEASLRSKIIGLFLAVLELLGHHQFHAEQREEFDEIWITLADPATAENEMSGHESNSATATQATTDAEPDTGAPTRNLDQPATDAAEHASPENDNSATAEPE